jgi:tRNA(Ile2) C34 agmatinyltransferase TiaS
MAASDKKQPNTNTPSVFSREEATQIRELVRTSAEPPKCPRCGETLEIGPPALHQVGGKQYTVRALTCPACHRLLSIRETNEQERR